MPARQLFLLRGVVLRHIVQALRAEVQGLEVEELVVIRVEVHLVQQVDDVQIYERIYRDSHNKHTRGVQQGLVREKLLLDFPLLEEGVQGDDLLRELFLGGKLLKKAQKPKLPLLLISHLLYSQYKIQLYLTNLYLHPRFGFAACRNGTPAQCGGGHPLASETRSGLIYLPLSAGTPQGSSSSYRPCPAGRRP